MSDKMTSTTPYHVLFKRAIFEALEAYYFVKTCLNVIALGYVACNPLSFVREHGRKFRKCKYDKALQRWSPKTSDLIGTFVHLVLVRRAFIRSFTYPLPQTPLPIQSLASLCIC